MPFQFPYFHSIQQSQSNKQDHQHQSQNFHSINRHEVNRVCLPESGQEVFFKITSQTIPFDTVVLNHVHTPGLIVPLSAFQ